MTLKDHRGDLTCLSVWGIFFSAVLGNALAYNNSLNRRALQAAILLASAAYLARNFFFPSLDKLAAYWRANGGKALKFFLPAAGLHIVVAAYHTLSAGMLPRLLQLLHLSLTAVWLFLLSLIFALPHPEKSTLGAPAGRIRAVLAAFAAVLAFIGWFNGPVQPDYYLSFGGHPGMAGICFAVAAFYMIWDGVSWLRYSGFSIFSMLCVLTTSRISLLVLILLYGMLSVRVLVTEEFSAKVVMRRLAAPLMIVLVLFLSPFFYTSDYFPYRVKIHSPTSNPRYYRAGYVARYSRMLMLLPGFLAKPLERQLTQETALDHLKASDSRMRIFARSLELISERPSGYWPEERFAERSGLVSGIHIISYPHNMVLETAYSHGVLVALALAAGLLLLFFALVHDIIFSGSQIILASSMAAFSCLIFFQFAGNHYDTVLLLVLCAVWLTARTGGAPAEPARGGG